MNIELYAPAPGEEVILLTVGQKAMLEGKASAQVDNDLDWENLKRKGTENSYPQPVRFAWNAIGLPARIFIDEDFEFSNPRIIPLDASSTEIDVYNFHANRTYYWKIVACAPEGDLESPVSRFTTADLAPTFYRVDGITNVRDIGGWKTASGNTVKRGRIYRGSEMDTHHALTEEGRQVMRSILSLRTDLDLRGEATGKIFESPIGSDIRFEFIPCKAYADFTDDAQNDVCKKLFSLFADETAYPIYLHCWGGADRAGTLVLLLNALLGVDDESLLLDYEMTLFSVWGERSRKSDLFCQLMESLNKYGAPGSTLSEKAVSYLRTAGVTEEQMEKIQSLMLEER